VGDAQRGLQIQAEYTSGGDKMHMCYGFDFLSPAAPTGTHFAEILDRYEKIVSDGWACWAFSNHDVERHASRWGLSEAAIRAYAALLLSLRGSVCLYQGEELGLPEAEIAFEDLRDPYGIRFWPKFKGRDGCRTPMPWAEGNTHGGFSEGKPWLPMPQAHLARAAARQEGDEGSTLGFYRAMLAFRKHHPALAKGGLRLLEAREDYLAILREHEGAKILAAFNLSGKPLSEALPEGRWTQDARAPFASASEGKNMTLPPWHAYFATAG
jgi:alpha-glucosidase